MLNLNNDMMISAESIRLLGKGIVSAEIVSEVFGSQPVPFTLDARGCTSIESYQAWLQVAGMAALAAFDDCSEIIVPKPARLSLVSQCACQEPAAILE